MEERPLNLPKGFVYEENEGVTSYKMAQKTNVQTFQTSFAPGTLYAINLQQRLTCDGGRHRVNRK